MNTCIGTSTASPSAGRSVSQRESLSAALMRGIDLLEKWRARSRTRRQLMSLGEDELKDIGLGRGQAYSEYSKPFWRP